MILADVLLRRLQTAPFRTLNDGIASKAGGEMCEPRWVDEHCTGRYVVTLTERDAVRCGRQKLKKFSENIICATKCRSLGLKT